MDQAFLDKLKQAALSVGFTDDNVRQWKCRKRVPPDHFYRLCQSGMISLAELAKNNPPLKRKKKKK